MTAFTADAASALLRPRLAHAPAAGPRPRAVAGTGLPTPDEEIWRYSRVADLDLDAYLLASADPASAAGAPNGAVAGCWRSYPDRAAHGGHRRRRPGPGRRERAGRGGRLSGGPAGRAPGRRRCARSVLTKPTDVFARDERRLRARPTGGPGARRARRSTDPVVVIHWSPVDGVAAFPRLVVDAGADSAVRVLDVYASEGDAGDLVVPVIELRVGPAARLGYVNVQSLALASGRSLRPSPRRPRRQPRRPRVPASAATTPGCAPTAASSAGAPPATCGAVYFGEGDQTLDFRTFQDHAAPDTTSDLLFKGAVGGPRPLGVHRPHPRAEGRPGHQRLPDQPQHQAVRRRRGPSRCPTSRSRTTTCTAATPRRSARSTRSSASTSRAGACRPRWPSGSIVAGFFDEVLEQLPGARPRSAPLRAAIGGQARPPASSSGGEPADGDPTRLCAVDELEPGHGPPLRRRRHRIARRPHRRRLLRHRRPLHPRRHLADRGRGRRRRARDRVLEARQHVLARDRRAHSRCRPPGRRPSTRSRSSTATTSLVEVPT